MFSRSRSSGGETMETKTLTQKPLDDQVLVIVAGSTLDNNNAHEMVEAISAAYTEGRRYVIIDMSALEFISSAGVGSILGTIEMFREKGGDVVLCNVASAIMHVFDVLDLGEYLTFRPDLPQAMTTCGAKT